jgi:hypothetical protein
MKRVLVATYLLLAASAAGAQAPRGASFEFVALGDMPYSLPADYPRYEALIEAINARAPAFSIHVGDTKSGSSPCSNEVIDTARGYFDKFAGAVFYTPGDNEWTDCHRAAAGRFDPLERLEHVRRTHFTTAASLGAKPMVAVRQSDSPGFAKFVENMRWSHEGVVFATIHIVGSNNGFERSPEQVAEYFERNRANLAWIAEAFAEAGRTDAPALVFAFQADLEYGRAHELSSGYRDSLAAFTDGAIRFGKPVLLIQGDSHVLVIDRPLKTRDRRTLETVTRLQVMGASEVHAVRVTVDPADPAVFGFKPLMVVKNLRKPAG